MFKRWKRNRSLKKIDVSELGEVSGDDWCTVWKKLNLDANLANGVIVAELHVGGKPTFPVYAFTGYSSTADVVKVLEDQLGLSDEEAREFLLCFRDKDFVIERAEEKLASLQDDSDDD